MPIIRFERINKSYETGKPVIQNLSLDICEGEFVTFLGPSGCGKTTMLKLVNRLIEPDDGNIYVEDREIREWDKIELRRRIGYVIQKIGLFPHLSVGDNISYVLDLTGSDKSFREKRAREMIELVGMDESFLKRYPRELSGGQRQRIGLARALAADPDIILMDEALGAVDEISRRVLQDELLKIYQKLKKTIVFVTHDIQEAIKLGSRIVLINEGKIVQSGTREEMIFSPANSFVEDFFGLKNFTSYLNLTPLKDVCEFGPFAIGIPDKMENIPFLDENESIMAAIRVMFDNGLGLVGIEGSETSKKGVFRFESAFKKLKENGAVTENS
ncbi:MAG TPA: ATP-binding cassette domain-containing protein [Clostridia bacterium]|nr:ATP-binding cassette domain-containing protein [Clostridia bacterium]